MFSVLDEIVLWLTDVKDIEDDGMSVQDDAIIHLTGDEDDEVDVESLMAKLGLLSGEEGKTQDKEAWPHIR